jgi:hypothetical protein
MNEELSDGSVCALTPGDVLTRIDDTPDANQNVKVLVSRSQKNDCASGSQFPVAVQDLQDMQNRFREQIDAGLGKLAQNQGKNGLPAAPDTARTPVPDGQAQPDLTARTDLQNQQQQADQTEGEVQQAATDGNQNSARAETIGTTEKEMTMTTGSGQAGQFAAACAFRA